MALLRFVGPAPRNHRRAIRTRGCDLWCVKACFLFGKIQSTNWYYYLGPATSILFAVQYARNNPDGILKASLVVVSLSVATNIIVTLLIASRIVLYLRESTMPDEERKPYMTIIGIIIESAALYAASGIVLTVTNALGHPSEQVAVSIYMLIPVSAHRPLNTISVN